MGTSFTSFDQLNQFVGQKPASDAAQGMLTPGNIDLYSRPHVKNPDGTTSTVRSISANIDGHEVLIPTVTDDGRVVSNEEAIQVYKKTGKHLGIFDSPANATTYASKLHDDYASGKYDQQQGIQSFEQLNQLIHPVQTAAGPAPAMAPPPTAVPGPALGRGVPTPQPALEAPPDRQAQLDERMSTDRLKKEGEEKFVLNQLRHTAAQEQQIVEKQMEPYRARIARIGKAFTDETGDRAAQINAVGLTPQEAQDARNLALAQNYLKDVMAMDPGKTGVIASFRREFGTPTAQQEKVPFAGAILKAVDMVDIYQIAKKQQAGEKLLPTEQSALNAFALLTAAQQHFNPGILDQAASVAAAVPSFATEFALTQGAYSAGRKVGVGVIEKAVKNTLARAVAASIGESTAGRLAARAIESGAGKFIGREAEETAGAFLKRGAENIAGWTTGGLAQSAVQPTMPRDVLDRMTPKYIQQVDAITGKLSLQLDQQGEDFSTALVKAFGQSAVNVMSERSGILLEHPMDVLKTRLLGKWLQKQGTSVLTAKLEKAAQHLGWNGILGEVFEEEIARPFSNAIDKKPLLDGYSWDNLATEFLGFSMWGAAGHAVGYGTTKAGQAMEQRAIQGQVQVLNGVAKSEYGKDFDRLDEKGKADVLYMASLHVAQTPQERKLFFDAAESMGMQAPSEAQSQKTFQQSKDILVQQESERPAAAQQLQGELSHQRDINIAQQTAEAAPPKAGRENTFEPPPIVGEPTTPGERELQTQKEKESEAGKRLTDEKAAAAEQELKVVDRRRVKLEDLLTRPADVDITAFRQDERTRLEVERDIQGQRQMLDGIAREAMYVDAADMQRSLGEQKRRGEALSNFQQHFLNGYGQLAADQRAYQQIYQPTELTPPPTQPAAEVAPPIPAATPAVAAAQPAPEVPGQQPELVAPPKATAPAGAEAVSATEGEQPQSITPPPSDLGDQYAQAVASGDTTRATELVAAMYRQTKTGTPDSKPQTLKLQAPPETKFGAGNKVFTEERMQKALAELKNFKPGSGTNVVIPGGIPVPENTGRLIRALVEVGGYYFEGGVREFAKWSQAVAGVTGEWAKPHLKTVYDGIKLALGETETKPEPVKPTKQTPVQESKQAVSKTEQAPPAKVATPEQPKVPSSPAKLAGPPVKPKSLGQEKPKDEFKDDEQVFDVVAGKATKITTPNNSYAAEYVLGELSELIQSTHPLSFTPNENYPQELQPRDRSNGQSKKQVLDASKPDKFDPAQLVNTSATPENGPPIATPGGIVLGGNGRVMIAKNVALEDRWDEYAKYLKEHLADFGFKEADLEGLTQPFIWRRLKDVPKSMDEVAAIGRDLNETMTKALDPLEEAIAAGKQVSQKTAEGLIESFRGMGDNANLKTLISSDPMFFIKRFTDDGIWNEANVARFTDPNTGGLSESGKDFVLNTLRGAVIQDYQLLKSLSPEVFNKMDLSLPYLLQLLGRKDEWAIVPMVRDALRQIVEVGSRPGVSIAAYQKQAEGLFGSNKDIGNRAVNALAVSIAESGPLILKKKFAEFVYDSRGENMFASPQAWDSFNKSFGAKLDADEYALSFDKVAGHVTEADKTQLTPPPNTVPGNTDTNVEELKKKYGIKDKEKLDRVGAEPNLAAPPTEKKAELKPPPSSDEKSRAGVEGALGHQWKNGKVKFSGVGQNPIGLTAEGYSIDGYNIPGKKWIVDATDYSRDLHDNEAAQREFPIKAKAEAEAFAQSMIGKPISAWESKSGTLPAPPKPEKAGYELGHPLADAKGYPPAAEVGGRHDQAYYDDPENWPHPFDRIGKKDREAKIAQALESFRSAAARDAAEYEAARKKVLAKGEDAPVAKRQALGLHYAHLTYHNSLVIAAEKILGVAHEPLRTVEAAEERKPQNAYIAELNGDHPEPEDLRETPEGQPTVADILKPGDIVHSNYGDIVYVVDSVSAHKYFGKTAYSIAMHDFGEKPHKGNNSYYNELVAVDGRILHLFKNNDDEVFKISKEEAEQKSGKTAYDATKLEAPPKQKLSKPPAETTKKTPASPATTSTGAQPAQGVSVSQSSPETAPVAPKPLAPKAAEKLTSALMGQQLDLIPGMTPEQRDAIIGLWEVVAKYKGQTLDQFVGENLAAIQQGGKPGKGALFQAVPDDLADEVRKGGGEPIGMVAYSEYMPEAQDLVYFNDLAKETLSTMALPLNEVTAEAVNRHIRETRKNSQPSAIAKGASLFQMETAPTFFHKSEKVVEAGPAAASGEQWLSTLRNRGVKDEEIQWTGLDDFLKDKKKVTKQELAEFIRQNSVEVQEVEKGGPDPYVRDGDGNAILDGAGGLVQNRDATKFSSYQLPGGENYRELLLTLPEKSGGERGPKGWGDTAGGTRDTANFRSSHFDEPNVLAHVRFNDRTDADGKKVLFLEELQSDWHQKGRKQGYGGPPTSGREMEERGWKLEQRDYSGQQLWQVTDPAGERFGVLFADKPTWDKIYDSIHENWPARLGTVGVPDAPFKKTWHELALKRMLRYAAENGYDKLAWTPGEVQNERYDLSKHVSRIEVGKNDGGYWFKADPISGGDQAHKSGLTSAQLEENIGKDLAAKAVQEIPERQEAQGSGAYVTYSGLDLKVGGSGMKGFYDQIIPRFLNDYGKKWGAKVGESHFDAVRGYGEYPLVADLKEARQWLKDGNELWYKLEDDGDMDMDDEDEPAQEPGSYFTSIEDPKELKHYFEGGKPDREIHKVPKGDRPEDHIKGRLVPSIPITAEMKQSVMEEGQALFQRGKGAVSFLEDGRAVINAFHADASTFLHESFHVFRRILNPADLKIVEKWAGVENGNWTVAAEEKWARGAEVYFFEGRAPNAEVKSLFQKFAGWLKDIYKKLSRIPGAIKLSDEVRDVYSRLLGGKEEIPESPESAPEAGLLTAARPRGPPGRVTLTDGDENTLQPPPGTPREAPAAQAKETPVPVSDERLAAFEERMRERAGLEEAPKSFLTPPPGQAKAAAREERGFGSKNVVFTSQRMQEAERRLNQKLGRLHAGLDASMMKDAAEVIGYYLEGGLHSLAEIGGKMVARFGDGIHPYLAEAYNLARRNAVAQAEKVLDSAKLNETERATVAKFWNAMRKLPDAVQPPPLEKKAKPQEKKIFIPKGFGENEPKETKRAPTPSNAERTAANAPTQPEERRPVEPRAEPAVRPESRQDNAAPGAGPDRGAGSTAGSAGPAEVPPQAPPGGAKPVLKSLKAVPAAKLDAPANQRGRPVYDADAWVERLHRYNLPENAPVPTVRLSQEMRDMLIFPGQPEVAEMALSGLDESNAFVIATSPGTGKTYMSSAILAELKPRTALLLTTSRDLMQAHIDTAAQFGVEIKELPKGAFTPPDDGIYITTYTTAAMREGLDHHAWPLVIADESTQGRRWYTDSKSGVMLKNLGQSAQKILYMSATPFHSAIEVGYMDKLGLWKDMGFKTWAEQFGIRLDPETGTWNAPFAPRKLAKLREQLIERGQFVNMDRAMEGYTASFGVVPLSLTERQGVQNIIKGFAIVEQYFKAKKMDGMIRAVRGNRTTYIKNYIERSRLPQAIEIGKKLDAKGWKVIYFSEHRSEVPELYEFMRKADEATGGEVSRLIPPLPSVTGALRKAFGDDLADYSGAHSAARTNEKNEFNNGNKKHIFATYGAGGVGVSLHDLVGDAPRAAVYLGLPWSGIMFDQAVGRPWRFGTKSNVHGIFLMSNSKNEVELVLGKVAQRFESLKAVVSGVDKKDPLVDAMQSIDGALDYEFGNEQKTSGEEYLDTVDTKAISSYQDLPIVDAADAMNKGMQLPEKMPPAPPPKILYQDEAPQSEPRERLTPPPSSTAPEVESSNNDPRLEADIRKSLGMPPTATTKSAEDAMAERQIPPPGSSQVRPEDLGLPKLALWMQEKGAPDLLTHMTETAETAIRTFMAYLHTAPYVLTQYPETEKLGEMITRTEMQKRREISSVNYDIENDILKDIGHGSVEAKQVYEALRRAQDPIEDLVGEVSEETGTPFSETVLKAAQRIRDEVYEPLWERAKEVRPNLGYLNHYATIIKAIEGTEWSHPAINERWMPQDLAKDFSLEVRQAMARDPYSPYLKKRRKAINWNLDIHEVMNAYVPSVLKVIHDTRPIWKGLALVSQIPQTGEGRLPLLRQYAERYLRTYAGVPGEYKETKQATYRLARHVVDMHYNALLQMNPKWALVNLSQSLQNTWPDVGAKYVRRGVTSLFSEAGRELIARAGILSDMPLPEGKLRRVGKQVLHATTETTEFINRAVSYLASVEKAKDLGMFGDPKEVGDLTFQRMNELAAKGVDIQKALNYAYDAVAREQFMYTNAYVQFWLRDHPILGMFKSFPIREAELVTNMLRNYKENPAAARRMLTLLAFEVVGGLFGGVPLLRALWPFDLWTLLSPTLRWGEDTLQMLRFMFRDDRDGDQKLHRFGQWLIGTGIVFLPGMGYAIREMTRGEKSESKDNGLRLAPPPSRKKGSHNGLKLPPPPG